MEELVELLSLSGKESGDDVRAGQCAQVPEHSLCPACDRLRVALAPSRMGCGQLFSESSVEMAKAAASNATQASATPHRSRPVETRFSHSQQGGLYVHCKKGHPLPPCPTGSCVGYTLESTACGMRMAALWPGCLGSDLSPTNCVWPSASDQTFLGTCFPDSCSCWV